MNTFDMTLAHQDESVTLETDTGKELAVIPADQLPNEVDHAVAGVRPEGLTRLKSSSKRSTTVTVAEFQGNGPSVHIDFAGQTIVAQVAANQTDARGDEIGLQGDADDWHRFEAGSGELLTAQNRLVRKVTEG